MSAWRWELSPAGVWHADAPLLFEGLPWHAKQNRSSQESLELMAWLAQGGVNEELRHIASNLDAVSFYEYAGVATDLPHIVGATVEHPLVSGSQETSVPTRRNTNTA